MFETPITLTPKRNKQTVKGIKIISMSPLKKPKGIFSVSPARKSFDWTRRSIKFNKLKINPKFIKKTVKPKKSLKLGLKRLVEQEYNLKEKIFSNHKEQRPLELKRKTSLKTRPTLKSPSKIRKLNRVY